MPRSEEVIDTVRFIIQQSFRTRNYQIGWVAMHPTDLCDYYEVRGIRQHQHRESACVQDRGAYLSYLPISKHLVLLFCGRRVLYLKFPLPYLFTRLAD